MAETVTELELLPSNCWVNAEGEPHPCPIKEHGRSATLIARQEGIEADSTDELFAALYALGYVRIQWAQPRRVNVVFHHLTVKTREKLHDFIDILLHSDYHISVFTKAGHEHFTLEDRYWRQKIEQLNRDPEAGQQDRFTGGGTNKTPLVG